MIKISPSILASDFSNLADEIIAMEKAGADMLHLDVMDGHFVPNISFGSPIISSIRKVSNIFFDTHLMISSPLQYADDFAKAGSNRITFHLESDDNPIEVIEKLNILGVEIGISVKPNTPIEKIYPYLDDLDQVLIMTVEPGFGGQTFMNDMCNKILQLAKLKKEKNYKFDIQVDGGIDKTTAPIVSSNGANLLVAGSALFSQLNYRKAIDELRSAGKAGLENKLF